MSIQPAKVAARGTNEKAAMRKREKEEKKKQKFFDRKSKIKKRKLYREKKDRDKAIKYINKLIERSKKRGEYFATIPDGKHCQYMNEYEKKGYCVLWSFGSDKTKLSWEFEMGGSESLDESESPGEWESSDKSEYPGYPEESDPQTKRKHKKDSSEESESPGEWESLGPWESLNESESPDSPEESDPQTKRKHKKESSDESESRSEKCCICMDAPAFGAAMTGCGHTAFCYDCAEGLVVCPLCRAVGKPLRLFGGKSS